MIYVIIISIVIIIRLINKNNDTKIACEKKIKELENNHKIKEAELIFKLDYLETAVPWLKDNRHISANKAFKDFSRLKYNKRYIQRKLWLAPSEYIDLSPAEKSQLSLDRYWQDYNKSKSQLGLEYERYIGYLCEKQNYNVRFTGALEGTHDKGRDLIISKGNEKCIIQCKRWSKLKILHENYIFQLYGTVELMKIETHDNNISGMFVTTAELSAEAKEAARQLGIIVHENVPMNKDYPCIKCNINSKGEKIYHLPFDKSYDMCVLSNNGGFYVKTAAEAEEKGFRRAYKHYHTDNEISKYYKHSALPEWSRQCQQ